MPFTLADVLPVADPVQIHGYSADVIEVLGYSLPRDNQVRLGMELELNPASSESRGDLQRDLGRVFRDNRLFIAKTDGSVPRGLEIVAIPLDLATFESFADALLPLRARAAANCGCHIHISRSPLSETQQWNMLQFIHNGGQQTQLFIDAVARRRQNHYCRRFRMSRMPANSSHYDAIGFSGRHPTMELRIFASTNKAYYLRSYAQFAMALVEFAASNDFDFQTPTAFVNFVGSNAARFPQLAHRIRHSAPFAAVRNYMTSVGSAVAGAPRIGTPVVVRTPGVDRERRAQTTVPTTAAVRAWVQDTYGVASDVATHAERLRGRSVGYMANQRAFVRWYSNNCFDSVTGERNYIRTSRGLHVRGNDIRSHALYHLTLLANG
jgi:hypothetical protein